MKKEGLKERKKRREEKRRREVNLRTPRAQTLSPQAKIS